MDHPYTREAPTDSTPADVVQRIFDSLDAKRWDAVAALADPEDVQRFAAEQVAELRRLETELSAVDVLREKSSLAPEVLERYARNEEESRTERRARFARLFGGRSTSRELAQLTPDALLLLWLAASDPAEQVRQSAAHIERAHPGFTRTVLETPPRISREIAHTEHVRSEVALVTYVEWLGDRHASNEILRVAELRRTAAGWRMRVDPELMGHASLWTVVVSTDE